jgi:hypothetical protein
MRILAKYLTCISSEMKSSRGVISAPCFTGDKGSITYKTLSVSTLSVDYYFFVTKREFLAIYIHAT